MLPFRDLDAHVHMQYRDVRARERGTIVDYLSCAVMEMAKAQTQFCRNVRLMWGCRFFANGFVFLWAREGRIVADKAPALTRMKL